MGFINSNAERVNQWFGVVEGLVLTLLIFLCCFKTSFETRLGDHGICEIGNVDISTVLFMLFKQIRAFRHAGS